ncbi:hypothetical protein CB0940_09443 [Cercospora beticola]|uniref:Uncharacterized protein n=1 Tax=Cercospora beticola TaxID=122368 RepID=A0A2G5HHX6_CERBT|nr:hypothetical protein CB0940_09443 [Cercospora beticola]PIA91803.1 hypothetical protein CB0940_09443 [Cercospora beticola]CAK1366126.1 unnamed protein product [Cercospora beticola]
MATTSIIEDLEVSLSASEQSQTVKAKVRNLSTSTTYTFFTWDTVLDSLSPLATGTLQLRSKSSGQAIESPRVLARRVMPPRREDLAEIAPKSETSNEVMLKGPWLPQDAEAYIVRAVGSWRAVWRKPISEISDAELESIEGDIAEGTFESNDLVVSLA